MNDRLCRNCGMRGTEHQNLDKYYPGLCQFDHLSLVIQEEINMGNIIPETDWEWVSYQPMNNLEYLEYESKKRQTM